MNTSSDLETIDFQDFLKVGLFVGTIISAELNAQAKIPAYKISVDFGELGIKLSSAQLSENYKAADLPGQQVIAVLNFPPKRVAGVKSEVLILGLVSEETGTILIGPKSPAKNGSRVL